MANIYEKITADMIDRIQKGAGKFEMPWHNKGAKTDQLPINAKTGNLYAGANCLQFWSVQTEARYESNAWATYKQWQELGAQVRKGERSCAGIYWKQMPGRAEEGAADQRAGMRMVGFGFNVFNAAQVDGWTEELPFVLDTTDKTRAIAQADAVVAASGADIRHGGLAAFYHRTEDYVQLPERWRFTGSATSGATESYYASLLHELTHWTGAANRLDRTKGKRFGDPAYAFEELVAEIGSAFLCARLGISNEPRADHAAYVSGWIKALQDDSRAIVNAASLAQKACDYLANRLAAPAQATPEALPLAA